VNVEPRHHTRRNLARATRGRQVAQLGEAKRGVRYMPWQRDALDVALELDPATGLYWYGIVVVTVQRQAGKTFLEGDVADHRCLSKRNGRVWFTMQTGKDAAYWMREEHQASLRNAVELYGPADHPAAPYKLSKRADATGVQWRQTGSTFYAFAPKRDAMHSKQSDLTFVDEAWAHDAEAGRELRQAIRPTMNTRPGAQLWIVSAAGDDGSAYFDEYLAMGRLAVDDPEARVCFIDYGLRDGEDPEDLQTILDRHPAYGHTIDLGAIMAARAEFADDPSGWKRAYANIPSRTRESIWPEALWTELGGPRLDPPARRGLSFDLTPLGDRYAIGAAWRDLADRPVVDLVDAGTPRRDLPELLAALARAGGVPLDYDPRSPATLEVVDAIGRLDGPEVELRPVAAAAYAGACVTFARAVFDRQLRHFHQAELDDAQAAATKTPYLDGGYGWARKKATGSIAELVVATLALRAYDTLPAAPRKPHARAGGRSRRQLSGLPM